jgi:hypothetical protein
VITCIQIEQAPVWYVSIKFNLKVEFN